ncbi:hypothetical protein P7228_11760 [Altererythrobacter arenosus]|uniref:Uncharacterized protein n=1 Tax=Altererythrobacter arenosus TaxID=3032592 RepID=A0ABY8FXC6_9SPHN|nr:hypothetical protein [Altererythrobacter sp. CAU 1644]WFL76669.1 hypothetical protein P7228_11760 [Altererythrobacter sp. CAU 1644]
MQSTRIALREILRLEEQGDWGAVESKSLELAKAVATGECEDPPAEIYRYIDDFDIRQEDDRYGDMQRADLRKFLGLQ